MSSLPERNVLDQETIRFERHLKRYPASVFGEEVQREIYFIFWREISCLPPGAVVDGVNPEFVETTKRGVEITGSIWFLPEGCPAFLREGKWAFHLCLSKPGFPAIESVSVEKVRRADITDSCFDGRTLRVIVNDTKSKTDEAPAD